ncbi:MAG: hypothetical protein JEZ08_20710 [Clostridiales bacterium]|nr:hypothetical protein [Clostridiales bacterium]
MSNDKYRSYNRIHNYANPSDVEKGKITKETNNYKKLNKKNKNLSKKIIREYEVLDDDILDQYDAIYVDANQQRKTAKGHKKRLKSLQKRDDFL